MTAILPYIPTHKVSLLEVFERNTPKYFDPSEVKEFSEYLEIEGSTYLSILVDGKVVGGGGYVFRDDRKTGLITWIFVDPASAGKGLGRDLVETLHSLLKAEPVVETLRVRTSQLVYPFFQKFGYAVVMTEKDYWAKGFDLVVMERGV